MIPPVSEMPVAATMLPTVRTVAACGPTVTPAPPRRCCGNCAMSEPCGDRVIVCKRDARGFDNHPVLNQRFPADRGPCIHHLMRTTDT